MHDERALHAEQRAVAGVDALELARDQAVGDVRETGAAIALGQGGAEEAELRHAAHDRTVEALVAEIVAHARHQLFVAEATGGLAHHALLVREKRIEAKRVGPIELRVCHRRSPSC